MPRDVANTKTLDASEAKIKVVTENGVRAPEDAKIRIF